MFNWDSDFEELCQIIKSDDTTPQQQSNIPRSPVYNMDPELSMELSSNMMMEAGFSNSPNSKSVQTYKDVVAPAEFSEDDRRFLASSSTMSVETKQQPFYELMSRSEDFTQNYHDQQQLSNLDGSSDELFSPASMTISSPRSTGTASSPVKLPSFEESFSPQTCQPQTSASNYQPQFAYAQPNAPSNYGYAQPAYPGNDQRIQLATPKKPTKRQPSNSSAPSPTKRGKGAPTNEYYFENQPFTAENYKEFFEILSVKQMGFTIFEFTPLKIETEKDIREYVQKTGADVQIWNGSYYEKTAHELKDGAQFAGSDIKKRIKTNMYMRNYNKKKRHASDSTAENLRSLKPNLYEEFLRMEAKTQQLEAKLQNYRRFILRVRNLEYDTQNDLNQVLNALKECCLYQETEIHDTL